METFTRVNRGQGTEDVRRWVDICKDPKNIEIALYNDIVKLSGLAAPNGYYTHVGLNMNELATLFLRLEQYPKWRAKMELYRKAEPGMFGCNYNWSA